MLRKIYEYLTLADYDQANEQSIRQVVKRFTRGNISLKNGFYMTRKQIDDLAVQGDRAIARLQKKIISDT